MLATIAKNKLQYLLGAILIVVLALAFSTYRAGAVTRLSKVSATQERARRDATSANWFAAQEQAKDSSQRARAADTARWVAMGEFYAKQANIHRVREANAVRWAAMTVFYTMKLQAS